MGDFVKAKFMHQTTVEKKNRTFSEPKKSMVHCEKNIMHTHVSRKKFLVYENVKKRMPVPNHPPPLPEIGEG